MISGDILYFWAEEQVLMVVMANEKGVRAYDIETPEVTDDGCVITEFFNYEALDEGCSYMGNARNFTPSLDS